jgi:hypothetical protein
MPRADSGCRPGVAYSDLLPNPGRRTSQKKFGPQLDPGCRTGSAQYLVLLRASYSGLDYPSTQLQWIGWIWQYGSRPDARRSGGRNPPAFRVQSAPSRIAGWFWGSQHLHLLFFAFNAQT